MTDEKKETPKPTPKKDVDDSPPGFIPEYPEGIRETLLGYVSPEEAKKAQQKSPPPLYPGDTAYKIAFLCVGASEPVVIPRIGGVNSLSITMACLGAALELQAVVAGFEVTDIATGDVVASVGLRDFISKVAPRIASATKQQIIHPAQLTKEQIESFARQQGAAPKKILE